MAVQGKSSAFVIEPRELARRQRRFRRSSQFLAASYETLLKKYPNRWIAVLDGEVKAADRTLSGINDRIAAGGIPRSETLVHYLDRSRRVLVL